ncbi:MAG: hypothetical protein ACOYBY_10980 [Dermatophilaceae bacterium]
MARWMVKALAVAPGLVVSTVVTSMVAALLPALAGAGVFVGGLAVTLLLSGRGERAAARVLLLSRPARPEELRLLAPALTMLCRAGLGPPVIELRVRQGVMSVGAGGMGRRTVAVSAGLLEAVADRVLPQQQAAAVIAHAAAITRDGWVRRDAAIAFWSLPWQVMQGVVAAVTSVGRRVPMTTFAWRMRAVVIAIAAVLNVQTAQPILAALVAALGVLSYAVPHWQRQWQRAMITAGDQALVTAGFAAPWAAFLRRCPPCPTLRRRLRDVDPADPVRPRGAALRGR